METGEQVEYFTRLDNPTLKLTYQMNQNNKFELSQQFNRKWQPYRNASAVPAAGSDAEPNRLDRHWPGASNGRTSSTRA